MKVSRSCREQFYKKMQQARISCMWYSCKALNSTGGGGADCAPPPVTKPEVPTEKREGLLSQGSRRWGIRQLEEEWGWRASCLKKGGGYPFCPSIHCDLTRCNGWQWQWQHRWPGLGEGRDKPTTLQLGPRMKHLKRPSGREGPERQSTGNGGNVPCGSFCSRYFFNTRQVLKSVKNAQGASLGLFW